MSVVKNVYFVTFQLFNIGRVNFFFQNGEKYKYATIALAVIAGILLNINVLQIVRGW